MRFAAYNLWNSEQGMPRRASWQRQVLSRVGRTCCASRRFRAPRLWRRWPGSWAIPMCILRLTPGRKKGLPCSPVFR